MEVVVFDVGREPVPAGCSAPDGSVKARSETALRWPSGQPPAGNG